MKFALKGASVLLIGQLLIAPIYAQAAQTADNDLENALGGFDNSHVEPEMNELDQALGGFDALATQRASTQGLKDAPAASNDWLVTGELLFSTQLAYAHKAPNANEMDFSGLNQARLQGKLAVEKDWDTWQAKMTLQGFYDPIYTLKGRDDYSKDQLDRYESEIELFDTYLQGQLSDQIDLKVGRQIEVWGTSDNIRITDVINPLDNRQPGLTDIENLRLPVTMTKLSYFWGDWDFSLLAMHEQRPPKEAAIQGEFFPIQNLQLPTAQSYPGISTESSWQTTFGAAVEGRFSGWDLSLYAAEVQDSRWHFTDNKQQREYGNIQMTGFATNVVVQDWLLKTEMALIQNLQYNTVSQRKNRIDALIGFEYLSIPDWSFSLEIADRWIQDYDSAMQTFPDMVKQHNWQTAFRASRDFNHDLAKLTYLITLFGNEGQEGGFHRIWLDYDLTDAHKISVGAIDYLGGDHLMWDLIKNNDRLFAEISFQM
ncbi:hypothetical protein CYQ88_05445 [Hydrogenovibrio sp. SC-1]|uniref:DUF1302 family protein n=1 Tax=Hydrogenovibrio sp. SC-1 TaxID=2065820 RepID=UPI000C7AE80A|nr:DUF1302 family protein [Hydrogenovibrio sp. SC-1]PLA74525.1 hypothetical protein CYQ88_05445 [Hydrogenovibrio sp. SC-1]